MQQPESGRNVQRGRDLMKVVIVANGGDAARITGDATVGRYRELPFSNLDTGFARVFVQVSDELIFAIDGDAPEHGRRLHLESRRAVQRTRDGVVRSVAGAVEIEPQTARERQAI